MEALYIQPIDTKNVNFRFYKRRINDWNRNGNFTIGDSFHAIYLGDIFLAAGNVSFDKEASEINISLLNGSDSTMYDYVQEEATKKLSDLAQAKYGKAKVKCL